MKRAVLFCFFLFQFTSSIISRQLVSGHLELVSTNFTTSEYELRVKVFNTIPTSMAQNLYIFSNSTKKIAQIIYKVPFVNSRSSESPLELPYYNYHCAVSATINSDSDSEGIPPASQYETTYATKLQLDPQVFNDPLGYTFVIEGMQGDFGNYDLELSNIEKYIPVLTSVGPFTLTNTLLLVLTTPALSIKNSSPIFAPYNPMIYCSGRKPVTLLVACQDPDQDELRYSLVKPYSVFSEHSPNITLDNLYPVVYKSPFTATNPLKGSISIDSKTGIMTISATGSGAYVVCVKVDQIRDGKVIGYTHKFYILYLSNCTNGEDPIPNLKADGFPQGISSISFCEGQSTKLTIESNPNWLIDWTLNGYPIPDTKNKSTIEAKKEGVYEVKVKYNVPLFNGVVLLGCTNINVDNVIVDFKKAPKTDISGQKQICVGGESSLKLNTSENLTYQWYKDGVKISGAVTANLTTKDKGKYWVQFTVVGSQNNCAYNWGITQISGKFATKIV